MKILKKISIIFLIFITFLCLNNSFAMTTTELFNTDQNMKDVKDGLNDFSNTEGIGGVLNIIIGLLQVAGTGVAVIMVTMLGIKYLLASVEEKAEIKKQAVPIVIGAVLLFGAANLMSAVEQFASQKINN